LVGSRGALKVSGLLLSLAADSGSLILVETVVIDFRV